MPIFEYRCQDCDTKYEVLHKSSTNLEEVYCPQCSSTKYNKLLSSFSSSMNSSTSPGSCATGACGLPQVPSCSTGMCGLN